MARPRPCAELAQTPKPAGYVRLLLNLMRRWLCGRHFAGASGVWQCLWRVFELPPWLRHNPPHMPDEKHFQRVATVAEIPPQSGRTVQVGTHEIALFNRAGTFYALANRCPHRGAALAAGFVDNRRVLCPLHLFDFDLATGKCGAVSELKVATYEVKVEGEAVFVLV